MTERAVPRPRKSIESRLAQPPTPIMELDLQDIELCGQVAEMTRSIEVPADLLAQMRSQLEETLGATSSEAEIDDRTVAMPTPPIVEDLAKWDQRKSSAPIAFAATQEMPTLPPMPETTAALPHRTRGLHVLLAVVLGLLVSGGEIFAAKTIPHVVAKVTHR